MYIDMAESVLLMGTRYPDRYPLSGYFYYSTVPLWL